MKQGKSEQELARIDALVERFARAMKRKFRERAHHRPWANEPFAHLFQLAINEFDELEQTCDPHRTGSLGEDVKRAAFWEAVDVANTMLMLADRDGWITAIDDFENEYSMAESG